MTTTLTIAQVPAWLDGYAKQANKSAMAGLLSAAARGTAVIQTQLIPMRTPEPTDRGTYKAGWHFRATPEGSEIYNAEAHAILIENGVRGENVKIGAAMIRALTAWVIRKGLVGKRGRGEGAKRSQEQEATSMAWAIARAMRKRGIFNRPGPGLGIMRELNDRYIEGIIEQEVVGALLRGLP